MGSFRVHLDKYEVVYPDNPSKLHCEGSKTLLCIVNILRTWLFHWPLTYNDWPINVEYASIVLVGGVLLRITATSMAVG